MINIDMEFFNQIRDMMMTFPSVVERQNDFGTKYAYFIRNKEFAHFHSTEQLDIRVSKNEIEEIAQDAIQNPFLENWILFNIKSEADAKKAVLLLKKAYDKAA